MQRLAFFPKPNDKTPSNENDDSNVPSDAPTATPGVDAPLWPPQITPVLDTHDDVSHATLPVDAVADRSDGSKFRPKRLSLELDVLARLAEGELDDRTGPGERRSSFNACHEKSTKSTHNLPS